MNKCYGCINLAEYNDGKFHWNYCRLKDIYTNIETIECSNNTSEKSINLSIKEFAESMNKLTNSMKEFAELINKINEV